MTNTLRSHAMIGRKLPVTAGGDRQQSADCIEKVDFLKLPKK
ncbi:hypothetical protein QN412_03215 [Pseudomonas sp. RTB3]|nr:MULTISPECIES: hypothetical protein [unclassified Pseudomonas]MEB0009728.1 hypothetical protein [Pseudomonas sp. RTB2]MEB0015965.1 hypothetical protein [Pseudomonas sp. RTB3]MEB0271793.1 hypothetical protein [Pseudomonas sp. 5B4]